MSEPNAPSDDGRVYVCPSGHRTPIDQLPKLWRGVQAIVRCPVCGVEETDEEQAMRRLMEGSGAS